MDMDNYIRNANVYSDKSIEYYPLLDDDGEADVDFSSEMFKEVHIDEIMEHHHSLHVWAKMMFCITRYECRNVARNSIHNCQHPCILRICLQFGDFLDNFVHKALH